MADNFFTRKSLGGVPNFVWIAGGVVGLFVLRSKQSSNSANSPQAQQAAQQQALAAQLAQQEQMLAGYGSGGQQGSQVLVLGDDGSGTPPASTPSQTGTGTTTGGTTAGGPAYYHVATPAEAAALESSHQELYWQPPGSPAGTYVPVPTQTATGWSQGLPGGTSIYAET